MKKYEKALSYLNKQIYESQIHPSNWKDNLSYYKIEYKYWTPTHFFQSYHPFTESLKNYVFLGNTYSILRYLIQLEEEWTQRNRFKDFILAFPKEEINLLVEEYIDIIFLYYSFQSSVKSHLLRNKELASFGQFCLSFFNEDLSDNKLIKTF